MVRVLRLLGWEVKKIDDQFPTFDYSFSALGVVFNFVKQQQGVNRGLRQAGQSKQD